MFVYIFKNSDKANPSKSTFICICFDTCNSAYHKENLMTFKLSLSSFNLLPKRSSKLIPTNSTFFLCEILHNKLLKLCFLSFHSHKKGWGAQKCTYIHMFRKQILVAESYAFVVLQMPSSWKWASLPNSWQCSTEQHLLVHWLPCKNVWQKKISWNH